LVYYQGDGCTIYVDEDELLQYAVEEYGEHVKIEFGPGRISEPRQYFTIGLNESADYFCDLYFDLELGIPFPDNSVHEIYSNQFLEHISRSKWIFFMNEMWRVLAPGGKMHHNVPHFLSPWSPADPTHKNQFSEHSFQYFAVRADGTPFVDAFSDYGIKAQFVIDKQVVRQGLDIEIWMSKPMS